MKGTSKILANVCANKVFPQPVGPTSKIFDLDSSTFFEVTRFTKFSQSY